MLGIFGLRQVDRVWIGLCALAKSLGLHIVECVKAGAVGAGSIGATIAGSVIVA